MASHGIRQRRTTENSCSSTGKEQTGDVKNSFSALQSAPPPMHTMAVFGVIVAVAMAFFPSTSTLDEIATIPTFSASLSSSISPKMLAGIRALCAFVIWCTSLSCILSEGWEFLPPYHPKSKLKRDVSLRAVGFRTMWPFTNWSWNLLGVYFTIASYIAWRGSAPPVLLRAAVITWQTAAPCALLVGAVVKYVLWPAALTTTHGFGCRRNLLMHNAPVLFVMTESVLLSGMPLRHTEACLPVLWGCLYILFAWNTNMSWSKKEDGPQYIYFFFDTTVPGYGCSVALLALLFALLFFFELFCGAKSAMSAFDGWTPRCLFTLAVCVGTMRFRD